MTVCVVLRKESRTVNSTCTSLSEAPRIDFGTCDGARRRESSECSACRFRTSSYRPLECSGLLFDTGDVLFDATVWWRWLARLLSRMAPHLHYGDLYRAWRRDYLPEVNCGRRDYWEAFRAYLRSASLRPAQIEEVMLACRPKHQQLLQSIRPLPGVRATLLRLAAAGMPLGVLSNSPYSAEYLVDCLDRLGLGSVFTTIIVSSDLGCRPRDEIGYVSAAQALGLAVSELAFVGHDTEELEGALAAGMSTIAFNYGQDARADVFLDRFEQLIQVVRVPTFRRRAG